MASFGGISWEERGRGGGGTFFPVHGAKVRYATTPIPGGAKIILHILGKDAASVDVPARCTAAQLSSLRGLAGTSGTLDYAGGVGTATLVSVDSPVEAKRGQDVYLVTLRFLIGGTFGTEAAAILLESGAELFTEAGAAFITE